MGFKWCSKCVRMVAPRECPHGDIPAPKTKEYKVKHPVKRGTQMNIGGHLYIVDVCNKRPSEPVWILSLILASEVFY